MHVGDAKPWDGSVTTLALHPDAAATVTETSCVVPSPTTTVTVQSLVTGPIEQDVPFAKLSHAAGPPLHVVVTLTNPHGDHKPTASGQTGTTSSPPHPQQITTSIALRASPHRLIISMCSRLPERLGDENNGMVILAAIERRTS